MSRTLTVTTTALAAVLLLNSLLGPLVLGVIDYRYTSTYENQGIGLDLFAAVIAAPLLLVAAWLSLRGSHASGFVALGPALMAAYMAPQYVLGAHYEQLPGNNEDFFLLHLGLFIVGAATSGAAWNATASIRLPAGSRRSEIGAAVLMFLVAGFLLLRYMPALAAIWQDMPGAEYREDPIAFWLIAFMDLGIVVPVAVWCGAGLLLGSHGSRRLMYAIVGWFALVGPAVAAMGLVMIARDDPHASVPGTALLCGFGLLFAAVAIYLFRPLFASTQGESDPTASS